MTASLQYCDKSPNWSNKKRKEIRSIKLGKETWNLFLFVDDVIA